MVTETTSALNDVSAQLEKQTKEMMGFQESFQRILGIAEERGITISGESKKTATLGIFGELITALLLHNASPSSPTASSSPSSSSSSSSTSSSSENIDDRGITIVEAYALDEETHRLAYTNEFRLAAGRLMIDCNVPQKYVGKALDIALSIVNKKLNKLPSSTTLRRIHREMGVLAKIQVAFAMVDSGDSGYTNYADGTAVFGEKFYTNLLGLRGHEQQPLMIALGRLTSGEEATDHYKELKAAFKSIRDIAEDLSLPTNNICESKIDARVTDHVGLEVGKIGHTSKPDAENVFQKLVNGIKDDPVLEKKRRERRIRLIGQDVWKQLSVTEQELLLDVLKWGYVNTTAILLRPCK